MTAGADPLILTLRMDEASFAHFDGLRRRHFPAARNLIPAHLTLFHQLPGEQGPAIAARLREVARTTPAFGLEVTGLRFLGRGVAYGLDSEPLAKLRAGLAETWSDWLAPQDRQGFRPHITVQNKVPPEVAHALHAELASGFAPFTIRATGLLLWHYRGGPWEAAGTFPFGDALSQQSTGVGSNRTCD